MPDNTTNDQLSKLAFISKLSTSMLDCARSGEWERVEELESRRKELMDQTFPLSDPIGDVNRVIEQIEKIQEMDKEILNLVNASREEISGLLGKLSTGRQAVSAYQGVKGK